MRDKKEAVRHRGTDSAKVIQVIMTETVRGLGTEDDPVRPIRQYWSLEGEMLAFNDPAFEEQLFHH